MVQQVSLPYRIVSYDRTSWLVLFYIIIFFFQRNTSLMIKKASSSKIIFWKMQELVFIKQQNAVITNYAYSFAAIPLKW